MTSNVQITGPDLKLKMNWSAVVDVVTELGVQGVAIALGVPPGPKNISGVIGKLKGVVKVDEPLESKAWTVVALCFASAIDELRPQTASEELRANVRNILNGTKLIIQNN